jgi:hypothetical protein
MTESLIVTEVTLQIIYALITLLLNIVNRDGESCFLPRVYMGKIAYDWNTGEKRRIMKQTNKRGKTPHLASSG